MKDFPKILAAALFLGAILGGVFLLANERKPDPPGRLKIAGTIFALSDIAKNIVKDKAEVITILPPGASPHTFEPTPAIIQNANGVNVLFKIGYGLDDWTQKVTDALGNVDTFRVSRAIALRTTDGNIDPHYWLTFPNASQIAKNMADALIEIDPANSSYYQNNLASYQRQLAESDKQLTALLAPLKNRQFATFHDAFFYFANRYNLQIPAVFEEFPGKEPTPEYLANFINAIKEKNVKIIFSEPDFSPTGVMQIARDLNVKLAVLNPVEGTRGLQDTYISLMLDDGKKIVQALK